MNTGLTLRMTDEDNGKQRYRYLVEFPNKLRVFVDNDQLLSDIIQKYAHITPSDAKLCCKPNIKAEEQSSILERSTVTLCPECGSTNLIKDTLDGSSTCMSCGLHLENRESQRPHIISSSKPKNYEINEEEDRYKVTYRSKSQTKYIIAVNKKMVENVYQYLTSGGSKLTASQIMVSLRLPMTIVRSALKILVFQGRAKSEHLSGKRKISYEAVQKSPP
jgi:hypothetical protein